MSEIIENSRAQSTQPSSYQFEGRQVEIRANAQSGASGLFKDAVFIDGKPLAVRQRSNGGYYSSLNFYQSFPTLRETANAAVVALGGKPLAPLRAERWGKLPGGLPDLDAP
jgi:hypothetical protein